MQGEWDGDLLGISPLLYLIFFSRWSVQWFTSQSHLLPLPSSFSLFFCDLYYIWSIQRWLHWKSLHLPLAKPCTYPHRRTAFQALNPQQISPPQEPTATDTGNRSGEGRPHPPAPGLPAAPLTASSALGLVYFPRLGRAAPFSLSLSLSFPFLLRWWKGLASCRRLAGGSRAAVGRGAAPISGRRLPGE